MSEAIFIEGGGRGAQREDESIQLQLSRSHFVPRSLAGYQQHLRKIHCEGYLDRRSRTQELWRRRWFLLKDGTLSYFRDKKEALVNRSVEDGSCHNPNDQHVILLDKVEAVRTEHNFGQTAFRVICSDRDDLILKADSKDEMQDWLFGFHGILASIIAHLLEHEPEQPGSGQAAPRGRIVPSKVIGLGHGREARRSYRSRAELARCTQGPLSADVLSRRQTSGSGSECDGEYGEERYARAKSECGLRIGQMTPPLTSLHQPSGIGFRVSDGRPPPAPRRAAGTDLPGGGGTSGGLLSGQGSSEHLIVGVDMFAHELADEDFDFATLTDFRGSQSDSSDEVLPSLHSLPSSLGKDAEPHCMQEVVSRSCSAKYVPPALRGALGGGDEAEMGAGLEASSLRGAGVGAGVGAGQGRFSPGSPSEDENLFELNIEEVEEEGLRQVLEGSGLTGNTCCVPWEKEVSPLRYHGTNNHDVPCPKPCPLKGSAPCHRGRGGDATCAGGLSWSTGVHSIMGRREKQEDRYCAFPHYNKYLERRGTSPVRPFSESQGFYGIYDGHCGYQAAQFLEDKLHVLVGEHEAFRDNPSQALKESFLALDKSFLELSAEKDWYCGSTALVAFLRGRELLTVNLGDCEAVLCRRGVAVEVSVKHSPGRPDEQERILAANGWVTEEKELFLAQLKQMDLRDPTIRKTASEHVKWTTITRVCGELSVSRAIGDRDFKGFSERRKEAATRGAPPLDPYLFAWPEDHSGEFYDDLLLAEPECRREEIVAGDEFLLMACDGLWDVLSKEEAVKHARGMFSEGMCAQAVSEKLCQLALRLGTSDNVTVIAIGFRHAD